MVDIKKPRSRASQPSSRRLLSPLQIFLTVILCSVSFYTGTQSGTQSSSLCAPTTGSSNAGGGSGNASLEKMDSLDERKIEAIVQQRLEAGKSIV